MRAHGYSLGVGGVKVSVRAKLSVKKKESDFFYKKDFVFRVIPSGYKRTV